jgi:Uma2 family endonuclease
VELIEGVVYWPSPIRLRGHGAEQKLISAWLEAYEARHPGANWLPSITVMLDDLNELQPDAMLIKGEPPVDDDGYLARLPELVVEVAGSSHARDLHQKKRAYERNGVGEYIVWDTKSSVIHWFRLDNGAYREIPATRGRIESSQFPGLVLDGPACLVGDRKRVLDAIT